MSPSIWRGLIEVEKDTSSIQKSENVVRDMDHLTPKCTSSSQLSVALLFKSLTGKEYIRRFNSQNCKIHWNADVRNLVEWQQ